jgi:hypothetical protein
VISKYLDSNKAEVQSLLLRLLGVLAEPLVEAKDDVEEGLQGCDELLMLCDMLTDCKTVSNVIEFYHRKDSHTHTHPCMRTILYDLLSDLL